MKKENEELKSRRDFFKKAAKSALPILGAVVLASSPMASKAAEIARGCNGSCYVGCGSNCSGGCDGGCKNSCYTHCNTTCKGSATNYWK